jgi:hypothetical protein
MPNEHNKLPAQIAARALAPAGQSGSLVARGRNIEEAEAKGDDPLGDLAQQLMQELSTRKVRLGAMREPAG